MIQSIRTTGPSSAVNSSNGPSDRAQRKRKHPRLDDFDDAMIPSPTDLDDGGDPGLFLVTLSLVPFI